MKNKLNLLLCLSLIVFATMGCGLISRVQEQPANANSNKSLVDKTIEDVADGESTGVQECDDVAKIISDYAKNSDDDAVTKAVKDFAVGRIKKSFRESIEQNKNDKKQMAENCRDLKVQLEKQLKAEKEKER